jgi:hypothetical protein
LLRCNDKKEFKENGDVSILLSDLQRYRIVGYRERERNEKEFITELDDIFMTA